MILFVILNMATYPGPEVFLGLANAKCEKTREEKGKTSGEFVSDSWVPFSCHAVMEYDGI
jgi:hypothetical protein